VRAQSHVVGAVLMVGLAVIAISGLTVGIGSLLESQAAGADAERVATALDDGLVGVERTGPYSHDVRFSGGSLGTEPRTLRLLFANGTVVSTHRVDALVFEADNNRVAFLAGATVRGRPGRAWLASEPPITSSERTGALVVGVPVLNAGNATVGGTGGVSATLHTNVSHDRRGLGTARFAVAIETATPGPFERYFRGQNATTDRRTFAGDSHESVVARYPGERMGYLVVHDLSLEVNSG